MKIENGQPKYWQLQMSITGKIRSGEFPDKSFLPAESELMRQYAVGRNTVRTALAELEKEGVLEKRRGQASRINASALHHETSSRKIAWLDLENISNPIYFEIFREVSAYVVCKGLSMDYIPVSKNEALDKFLDNNAGYAGAIYSSTENMRIPDDRRTRLCALPNLIGVDLERNMLSDTYAATDSAAGFETATQYLIDTGHRHILYTGWSLNYYAYQPFLIRQKAFRDTLKKNGIPHDNRYELIITEQKDIYDIRPILQSCIKNLPAVDAIIAASDALATNCIYALKSMGINVPLDISVIGFDGLWQGMQILPRLTTVRQPVDKIAVAAVDMLLRRAGQPNPSPEHIFIKPEFILRDSVFIRNAEKL